MKYKGEYAPSFLADPVCNYTDTILLYQYTNPNSSQETFEWYPLETCILQLAKNRYACFSNPDHSIEGEASAEVISTLFVSFHRLKHTLTIFIFRGG